MKVCHFLSLEGVFSAAELLAGHQFKPRKKDTTEGNKESMTNKVKVMAFGTACDSDPEVKCYIYVESIIWNGGQR